MEIPKEKRFEETIRMVAIKEDGVTEIFSFNQKINDVPYQIYSLNTTHFLSGMSAELLLSIIFTLNLKSPPSVTFLSTFLADYVASRSENPITDEPINLNTVENYLLTNKTDVVLGYFYFLPARLQVANVLAPISRDLFQVHFRQSESPPLTQNPFVQQFSFQIFLLVGIVLLIAGVLQASFQQILTWSVNTLGDENFSKINILSNVYDTWFWIVGLVSSQGYELPFVRWEVAFIDVLMRHFTKLVYTIYCALLIAALTQKQDPIREVHDLYQNGYTFFAPPDTRQKLFSKNDLAKLWIPPSNLNNILKSEEVELMSINRLFTHRHVHLETPNVFHSRLFKAYKGTEDACEVLSYLPFRGGSVHAGLYVRKQFPLRNEFNIVMTKLHETGVLRRTVKKYEQSRRLQCLKRTQSFQDKLGLDYLGLTFVGLGISAMLTLVILLAELYLYHKYFTKALKIDLNWIQ